MLSPEAHRLPDVRNTPDVRNSAFEELFSIHRERLTVTLGSRVHPAGSARLWLHFVQNQLETFNQTIQHTGNQTSLKKIPHSVF